MPGYKKVYQSKAKEYEALVSKEDYQGNLLPAIKRISPIEGMEIVEFGAGTGRITRLLAPGAKTIRAFDAYITMIEEGRARISESGITNVTFELGENKAIPAKNLSADMTIAGWTFGHCVSWFPETWKDEITLVINEMKRITRSSGIAIILETLGTGHEEPLEPNQGLAEYYTFLENKFGFARSWIRTDYRFDSMNQANELTQAFFGRTFPLKALPGGHAVLPECTGIWHRYF